MAIVGATVFRHRIGRLAALILALMAVLLIAAPVKQATAQSSCGSVQARVDQAPAGSTVDLPDGCVYREDVNVGKPLTLVGGPGVEIRGSDLWSSGWTKNGAYWVKGTVPNFNSADVRCKPGTIRCAWPEQVFLDGKQLEQVASDPKPGQFAIDANRRVVLAEDPATHKVEVTMRESWLQGANDADDVTIDSISFRHAANARNAALKNSGDRWVVKNSELAYSHSVNISLTKFSGLRMQNNDIHHAGQMGASCNDAISIDVVNNRIHDNNTEDFDPGWATGGIKVADTRSFNASGNEVWNNPKGIWTDVGAENVTITNNRVHHNSIRGMDIEITDHLEMSENVIYENGMGSDEPGLTEAGILLKSVRDAKVHDNILAWNDDGITVLNPSRASGVGGSDPKYALVYDVHVYHNDILSEDFADGGNHAALSWIKTYADGNLDDPQANNSGYSNRYFYVQKESSENRFKWVDVNTFSLTRFNETPGDENARYLSAAEKDLVASSAGIPSQPGGPTPPPDTTPPAVLIDSRPETPTNDSTPSFGFSSDDPGAPFECSLSAGADSFSPCASSKDYAASLPDGTYTFKVKATDAAGNVSQPRSYTFEVDTTAPTSLQANPPGGTYSQPQSVTLSASDPAAKIFYTTDGSTPTRQSNRYTGPINVDKNTTLKFIAVDEAGNASAISQDFVYTFVSADSTAPETTVESGPGGPTNDNTPTFGFGGSDDGGGNLLFSYKVDGGSWSAYAPGTSATLGGATGLGEGSHTFYVRAKDGAGNVDASPAEQSFKVDSAAPSGTVTINNGLASTSTRSVTLTLKASDPTPNSGVAEMRFRNEGSTSWSSWQPYATSKSWSLSSGAGTKTVQVQFRDKASNVSTTTQDTIKYR